MNTVEWVVVGIWLMGLVGIVVREWFKMKNQEAENVQLKAKNTELRIEKEVHLETHSQLVADVTRRLGSSAGIKPQLPE